MAMKIYTLGPVELNAVDIQGNTDLNVSPGLITAIRGGGGSLSPTLAVKLGEEPKVSFTTKDVATALGAAGVLGLDLASGAKFSYSQIAQQGTRTAGSTHVTATILKGLAIPKRLSVSKGELAELSYEIFVVDPTKAVTTGLVISAVAALPSVPGAVGAFSLGPVVLNGTTIDVQGWSLDFGLNVEVVGSNGAVLPVAAGIMSQAPSLTIRTVDAGDLAKQGTAITTVVAYLRKCTATGPVADATATNIKFTIEEGLFWADSASASHGGFVDCTLNVSPVFDGSNAIIVVDTASAIT